MLLATALSAALSSGVALVAQDNATLRAAPHDTAQTQAQLTAGDALEIRGERLDYLQVYDHRRERAGYVRASQVRLVGDGETDAPALLSVLRFLRDQPGAESLGIAYVAAYLKAAPASQITAEPFDALGVMAERLARRGSARSAVASPLSNTVAAQLDGVAQYGVRITSYEQDGAMRLCYDGEAFRRVLAMTGATPEQRARAVFHITRPDCTDPAMGQREREALTRWRVDRLDSLDATSLAALPPLWKNRYHLRRASVLATLAFEQARRSEASQTAGQGALAALASVVPSELADDDQADYTDAAIRVGASRWAAELPALPKTAGGNRPVLQTVAGQPGETCVLLTDAQHDAAKPLLRRCTWGVAWLASATGNTAGTAFTLAVQPLAAWRELWLFRQTTDGWTLETLPPGTGNPLGSDIGYLESAGWVREGEPRLLLARESRTEGKATRRFEVTKLDGLAVDKQASTPQLLSMFQRWQDPAWKRQSVALR